MTKPIYPNLRDTLAGVDAFIYDINTIFVSYSHQTTFELPEYRY